MAHQFLFTKAWLKQELAANSQIPTLFKRGVELYEAKRLAQYQHSPDVSVLAGAYGGILKTWQARLIEAITTDIINELKIDPGRLRIKAIQTQIFGRAQASGDLKRYAVTIRNGGGRTAPMTDIPADFQYAARQIFGIHKDDLKAAIEKFAFNHAP